MDKNRIIEGLKFIDAKADVILRGEVMEADCYDFPELANKMAQHIRNICKQLIGEINEKR